MHDPDTILHYFDVLLKHSSFTKAARELYISQPYLTQTIKRLEKSLGSQLLERSQVPFTLTPAGRIYYQYLERQSLAHQQLERLLAPYTNPERRVLRITVLESLGSYLLPALLPPFLKAHPECDVEILEALPRKSESMLLNNEADCYLGQTPETVASGIQTFTNGGERYYIVIPQNSPYFRPGRFILPENTYDPAVLLQEKLVLSKNGSAIRHQINGLLQKYRIKPHVILESQSVITAAELATKGLGLTISSASILRRVRQTPINLLPLAEELLTIKFFIAVAQKHCDPLLKSLIETFQGLQLQAEIN